MLTRRRAALHVRSRRVRRREGSVGTGRQLQRHCNQASGPGQAGRRHAQQPPSEVAPGLGTRQVASTAHACA
eukprot:323697-Chlamydomonas_euryale.AAC.9